MSTVATWELVQAAAAPAPALYRLNVTGGWLVSLGAAGMSPAFVYDPTHAWVLPAVVVPPVVVPPVVTPPVVVPATGIKGHSKSIGLNLSVLEDYSVQVPFNDMISQSRDWISHKVGDWSVPGANAWDDGRALDLDTNGYVRSLIDATQQPGSLISYTNGPLARPAGTYVLTWDGVGTVAVSGTTVTKTTSNSITFTYNPVTDQYMEVHVSAIPDKANYPRNMHILQQGVTARWDSRFLALFNNVNTFRFMDWGRTNNSTLANWVDRPMLSSRSQSGAKYGVSLEAMIDLCNTTGTNGWFCIPHLATDDYVSHMALLIKSSLRTDLKCYIEYSNEVWNSQFQQAAYALALGTAMKLNTGFSAQLNFYSLRAGQCMDIFKNVFGTDTRLVRVISGMGLNDWVTGQILGYGATASKCDVFAIADYFGYELGIGSDAGGSDSAVAAFLAKTPDQQMDAIAAASAAVTPTLALQMAALKPYGIPLVAYEGGPHLVGVASQQGNAALEKAFEAAAVNPRMGTIIANHLAAWRATGGGLFCYFSSMDTPTKYGNWGAMTSMADTKSVKWAALQAVAKADPF